MDGFELYNEIRKADDKASVCFITATDKFNYESESGVKSEKHRPEYNEGLSQQHYCALRKDMFIQKPFSNDDLINEINNRIKAR